MTNERRRILVIGLDGAEPSLVFDRWRADLPTLDRLMAEGLFARLESTVPAITVPAWASMMTGRDPGQLGIYGFRNRLDSSYGRLGIANALSVRYPRVWDLASSAGLRVATIAVPQTFPVRPVNGYVVGCFLTPGPRSQYAYPLSLKAEVERWIGGDLLVDVPDFRSEDKERILGDIYRMADQHFEICRRLLARERFDFFMTVDMGVDRIHHGFWKYMDPAHPKHVPGHPLASAIHDYYVYVDRQLESLLGLVPDDTIVVVCSDHGGQAMSGGICLNEWLVESGLLVLERYPETLTPFEQCDVRWPETSVWGDGGYYGRVFLNVAGREPEGRIPAADYRPVRDRLAAELAAIPDPDGAPLGTRVFKPEEIYREVRNVPPDLIVYFGDLEWRSVGSLGSRTVWTFENDTGPDDANHSQHGILVLVDPLRPGGGERLADVSIYDVGPTLLR
ncbi:MAG TPA: alkaline phosphatase family protein, partial [Candidatus Limnocylindrales bacterium]|nr:alkaline phosphatase family protein [Candidatus Limnocylindrales bacterium]